MDIQFVIACIMVVCGLFLLSFGKDIIKGNYNKRKRWVLYIISIGLISGAFLLSPWGQVYFPQSTMISNNVLPTATPFQLITETPAPAADSVPDWVTPLICLILPSCVVFILTNFAFGQKIFNIIYGFYEKYKKAIILALIGIVVLILLISWLWNMSFIMIVHIVLVILMGFVYLLGFYLSIANWSRSANPSPGYIPEYAVTFSEHVAKERRDSNSCWFTGFYFILIAIYVVGLFAGWGSWITWYGVAVIVLEIISLNVVA